MVKNFIRSGEIIWKELLLRSSRSIRCKFIVVFVLLAQTSGTFRIRMIKDRTFSTVPELTSS